VDAEYRVVAESVYTAFAELHTFAAPALVVPSEFPAFAEFVSVVSAPAAVVDAAEHQVSEDTAFDVDPLFHISAVVFGVYNYGHPMFYSFSNIDCCASLSNYVEVFDGVSAHSPSSVHTICVLRNIFSSPDPHQNKTMGRHCKKPIPDHSNANGTTCLPMDATTSRSRKRCLHLFPE
jgi:hypothetical protein